MEPQKFHPLTQIDFGALWKFIFIEMCKCHAWRRFCEARKLCPRSEMTQKELKRIDSTVPIIFNRFGACSKYLVLLQIMIIAVDAGGECGERTSTGFHRNSSPIRFCMFSTFN
jgi:hypothetical protein